MDKGIASFSGEKGGDTLVVDGRDAERFLCSSRTSADVRFTKATFVDERVTDSEVHISP